MVEKLTDAVHGIQMIVNKTDITETDLREATKFVDQALQVDQSVLQRSQEHVRSVLLGLDAVIMRIRLQPGERVNTSTQHVTVFVLNVQLGRPAAIAVQGGVGRRSVDEISLADISSEKDPLPPETEAAVILPQSLDNATSHLSFAIFKEDSAFQDPKHNDSRINSFVIGINMADGHELGKDQHVDILFKPRTREGHKECVFWDFELNGGGWSTDGCRLDSWPASQFDTCRCNHLTHFAQIIVPRRLPEDAVLDVVSTVGCSLSLLGLIGVLLTGATSRRWSSRLGNKILMHLSGAEALNMLAFLIAAAGAAQGRAACIAVGVILHYSVLASFCWMLVSAGLQYLRLVSVLGAHHTSHLLLKSSLFAWGAPLLPVCVLLAVDVELYKQDESEFCYPVGLAFYLAVLCPVLLVIIINVSVYGTILHTVFARSSVRRHMQVKRTFWTRRVATSVLLFFLLGLSWVFGLLCSFSTVFVYLFCITATLQGFVLFLFFVLGERETRGHWFSKETTSPPTSGCTQTSNQYLYEATSSIIIPRVRYMEPDPSTCFQKNVTSTFSQ